MYKPSLAASWDGFRPTRNCETPAVGPTVASSNSVSFQRPQPRQQRQRQCHGNNKKSAVHKWFIWWLPYAEKVHKVTCLLRKQDSFTHPESFPSLSLVFCKKGVSVLILTTFQHSLLGEKNMENMIYLLLSTIHCFHLWCLCFLWFFSIHKHKSTAINHTSTHPLKVPFCWSTLRLAKCNFSWRPNSRNFSRVSFKVPGDQLFFLLHQDSCFFCW